MGESFNEAFLAFEAESKKCNVKGNRRMPFTAATLQPGQEELFVCTAETIKPTGRHF
jgi:hypothetical protein